MGLIYANMSMSLDGFIAGPHVSVANGMGDGGEQLHDWMFAGKSDAEAEAWLAQQFESTGAVLMGRTMLDVGIGPWGENPVFHTPVFVVTHRSAEPVVKAGGTSYTFVTNGPDAALRMARAAAGEQDIRVEGGAAIVRVYLHAGVIDELRLHVVPILLGDGTRLFTGPGDRAIELTAVDGGVDAHGVTHLRCRVAVESASGGRGEGSSHVSNGVSR
jgi:dihydrofolate reductase